MENLENLSDLSDLSNLSNLPNIANPNDLKKAFAVFNQVSEQLTQTYEALQNQVASLTKELAIANGKLLHQFKEKEALSERLTLLLNELPAGIIQLDDSNLITSINPAAQNLFGDEIIGQKWQNVEQQFLKSTNTKSEYFLISQNTNLPEKIVSIVQNSLPSKEGKIVLIHDITVAYKNKLEAERNQRLISMGEMAASLAHQIRTPLSAALLYTSNISQPNLNEAAKTKFANKATLQIQRVEHLIQDALLFAKGESIGKDKIDITLWLNAIIQTLEPLCKEKSVHFDYSKANILQNQNANYFLVGNKKSLFGAIINILENALQATENSQNLPKQITFSAEIINAEFLKLSICDNGEGIPLHIQQRIFEPFFTTKSHGTGLGLAIALGVIRAYRGKINVNSNENEGTMCEIELPIFVEK